MRRRELCDEPIYRTVSGAGHHLVQIGAQVFANLLLGRELGIRFD